MKQNFIETIIGFSVIIIAILFLNFAYQRGQASKAQDGYIVRGNFESAEGITEGSDIMLAGIKIGYVDKLELDKESFLAILKLRIRKDIKLPKDSQAAIVTSGFLGGKFISITPGGDEELLENNSQITRTTSALNLETLMSKLMYSFTNKDKDKDKKDKDKEENKKEE